MNLHPLVTFVRSEYPKYANAENAAHMKRYMKSEMDYHGVKAPIKKQINQQAFKQFKIESIEEYDLVLKQLWDARYREERYSAIAFSKQYKKFQTLQMLPTYRMMIETGAWWDYVDAIAAHLIGSLLSNYPEEMKPEMYRWIKDDDLWIRRSAILSQLRFKQETDSEMLFEFCSRCIHEESFWIRKAIGWALREYSKSNADSVSDFITEFRSLMSRDTLKEAEKYI